MKYIFSLMLLLCLLACQKDSVEQVSDVMIDKAEKKLIEKMESNDTTMQHTVEIRLDVPDSTWSMQIEKVIQTQDHIAVFCALKQSDMMGMMVISEVVDAVEFTASNLPIKNYVRGKTWNWENVGKNKYVNEFPNLVGKEIIFKRVPASEPGGPKKQPLRTPL